MYLHFDLHFIRASNQHEHLCAGYIPNLVEKLV